MPLWSDLFRGHSKDAAFKPKKESKAEVPCSDDEISQSNEQRTLTTPPSERRTLTTPPSERRTLTTPPSERRTPPKPTEESGYKTPPPSTHSATLDDTIATIQKAQNENRERKSSTPKTPQTPRPPTIHLDPVSDDSHGKESFSVDWKLDNIMQKSVKSFSESIQSLSASPANPNPWILVEPKIKKRQDSNPEVCEESDHPEKSKYKVQVDEIEDLWNDLVPLDESYLADCSIGAMEFSLVTDKNTDVKTKTDQNGEDGEVAEPLNDILTDNIATDNIETDNIATDDMVMDLESEGNLLDSQDLFKLEALDPTYGQELEPAPSLGCAPEPQPSPGEVDPSPHKQMGRILALQAANDALRDAIADCVPLSTVQELQNMLAMKEQELERVELELEAAQEQSKRLNMLNMIHMENEIVKDTKVDTGCSPMLPTTIDTTCSPMLPTTVDTACSPMSQDDTGHVGEVSRDLVDVGEVSRGLVDVGVNTSCVVEGGMQYHPHKDDTGHVGEVSRGLVDVGVNTSFVVEGGMQCHPHKSNITSLLARLNLEDSRLGNKSIGGDETLDITTGAPDLSLFDLTLTTGLSVNSDQTDQTLLVNHLCDIQSEAMKLQGRSEELCRENEKLQSQMESVSKELEIEKGKVKSRIKEVKEEREKCKKLDNQLKANKDIHKKKLEEVFAFHQRELEELTAKQELSEEQAKGLAKLINVEPDKEVVSTDCQTSMVFSNFVLHMSTDRKGGCHGEMDDNEEETALKEQLQQVEEEYLSLKEHTRTLEDTYTRQNEENNALIEMTNKEKKDLEDELLQLREVVSESEELISGVLQGTELPTMTLHDNSVRDVTQQSNDTINYTQLTIPPENVALPQATRYLVGIYKTSSDQIVELEQALQRRTSQHHTLVTDNSKLHVQLGQSQTELDVIKAQMVEEVDLRDKLLDANRQIAKLKGEILKLSTEAQNEKLNNSDELIEENEELKDKVEKIEEVQATLINDLQILREQLDEELDINHQTTEELAKANDLIDQFKGEQDKLAADLQASADQNTLQDDKIRALEAQLAELQEQIKKEKNATKDLLEKAEDASVSRNRHDKVAEELRATTDELRAELRRKAHELDDVRDNSKTLQRKLSKLQPSLDSYEEENLRLKEQVAVQGDTILQLQEDISVLSLERDTALDNVNSSLKQKLKDAKGKVSECELEAEARDRALRKTTTELHECKEDLASAEEKVEKLESALEELKNVLNVRKKSASSQAAVSTYDMGSSCILIDGSIDPELQRHYDKLKAQFDQMSRDLEAQKQTRSELEVQMQQHHTQQATKDNFALQLQQEHALAMERLRSTLTAEKEETLEKIRRDTDETRRRQDETYHRDMERNREKSEREHGKQMEKLVGDMETKRRQDCAMIARKVGLDPESLSTLLPGSTQLSDRIEALHKQAIQIRDMALSFYEASHPPAKEVSVQAIVKMFSCATQSADTSPQPTDPMKSSDSGSLQDFIKVFKEAHDNQTEVLLKQLKSSKPPSKATSPSNSDITQLRDEIQRLRLSVETYTTRCAILEHNNRLLKDRNTGLENDLIANATHQNSFMLGEEDDERHYDSHVQRAEPRNTNLRKRLAEYQKEIGKLQSTISEYQDGIEQLELELEEEKGGRRDADKRVRLAESAVIEIKNDKILANDDKAVLMNTELDQAKESCRLLEKENDKLKSANGKLKNLNISLLESNKNANAENFVLNVSSKSSNLINEIDSMKAVEDLRFELISKETEVGRKTNRISLLESEIVTKSNMITAQRDELDSKEKVIKLIKSEMSSQQMDIAELKAMLDVERSRSDELDRRLKSADTRPRDWSDSREEVRRLRSENAELAKEHCETPSSRRVTKAYLKYLRAESARKALVFQKQYLLSLLSKARAVESAALAILEIKKDDPTRKKARFKHAAVMVVAAIRMKNLVLKWRKVKESIEEKERRKQTPSICHTSQLSHHKTLFNRNEIPQINFELQPRSPSPSPNHRINSSTSLHSGYPKWDSSRPLSPPSHPRDGLSNRVYGSPSPDPSLSRLDQQLARLRHTINTRNTYNANDRPSTEQRRADLRDRSRVSDHVILTDHVIPERDSGISKPVGDDDGSGTLSDISNYISRLEAVQSRLTDLKLSSYKIYDSNRSSSR